MVASFDKEELEGGSQPKPLDLGLKSTTYDPEHDQTLDSAT